jgi:hypothetical protein
MRPLLLFASVALVHYFYDPECCAGKDCHPVPCEQVVDDTVNGGWNWHQWHFSKRVMKVSEDGDCHVCVPAGDVPATYKTGRCIYLPPRT